MLLERGAAIDFTGYISMTLFHWALDARKPQAVWLLLKYGVNVNVRDKSGETPSQVA